MIVIPPPRRKPPTPMPVDLAPRTLTLYGCKALNTLSQIIPDPITAVLDARSYLTLEKRRIETSTPVVELNPAFVEWPPLLTYAIEICE